MSQKTISRNQSYWKHFLEFGNILAFKPVFKLNKNKLILENKHINKLNLSNVKQKIIYLKKEIFFIKINLRNFPSVFLTLFVSLKISYLTLAFFII